MRFRIHLFWLVLILVAGAQAQPPAGGPAGKAPAKAPGPAAPTAAPTSAVQKTVETYLRNLYAWGPEFQLQVGEGRPSNLPGFNILTVRISLGEQTESADFYLSADNKFMFRGDVHDLTTDPFAANRALLKFDGSSAHGPADAKVTVVEFSDFQCPACREMSKSIRALIPNYPQVRFVFKHFPLQQAHPWAMNAALAGHCASQQSPEIFWKLHDLIFDNQDSIKTDNAWQLMLEYSAQAGADTDRLRVCMTSPDAKKAVEANIAEGQALRVIQTPTSFINGRRLAGPDRGALEQLLKFELATQSSRTPPKP